MLVSELPQATQPNSGVRRVPFFRRCRLQALGADTVGVVCNLSSGGAYVATQSALRVGDQVRISFQLPWREESMVFDAVVCWDNSDHRARALPPGCGLEFLAPAWSDQLRIQSVIRAFGRGRDH